MAIVLFGVAPAAAQAPEDDTPRGIFDTQTQQKASSNTRTRKRTKVPQRPPIPAAPAEPLAKPAGREKVTALRFCVMSRGRETPAGYDVGRNLTKLEKPKDGKPYGLTDPQGNFREGDILYLLFEVSKPGYLYVVNLGSDDKTRTLIYPDPGQSAAVVPETPVMIGALRIDPPPGVDRLTVLFSPDRITGFEDPTANLTQVLAAELNRRQYKTISQEEVYLPSRETLALYFANRGDLLKAEIDIKHVR
ncbi:MAG: DUF4384 domain-containing protein [Blastocatellia bacterium]|nr:DUF4384 domain-containing protein [Blastocatellia bacterium]